MHPQTGTPRWLAACLVCLLFCGIRMATAFRVGMDFSQMPAAMIRGLDQWKEGRAKLDAIHVLGPPHPTDPMTRDQQLALINMFKLKSKIVITTWDTLMGKTVNNVNVKNFPEYVYQRFRGGMSGGSAGNEKADIHVWDVNSVYGTGTAPKSHLDYLQQQGFPKVCILVRKWAKDEGYTYQAQIKESILHPLVKCIVMEGSPAAMSTTKHGGPVNTNHRLEVAKFVATTGKPFYILNPPGLDENRYQLTHLQRLDYMIQDLTATLGKAYVCSDKLTILLAAYPVPEAKLTFLPERGADGRYANTFTGGIAFLNSIKHRGCPGSAPAPAPTLPMQPVVDPDVCMDQCKQRRFDGCDKECVRGSHPCLCRCRRRAVEICSMKCRFQPPSTPYNSQYCNSR